MNNIIGKTFNRWTVIGDADPDRFGHRRVLCKCTCGTVKSVDRNTVIRGKSKSCGCLDLELKIARQRSNLEGKRFGKLIVIEPPHKDYKSKLYWLCKCDCGNYSYVDTASLTTGNTKSCRCLAPESTSKRCKHDFTGRKYKRLTVIKEIGRDKFGKVLWLCKCDCGGTITATSERLKNGDVKSCGCLQSFEEIELREYVKSLGYKVRKDRKILDGKEIDIYIPELKIGIEYCGSAFHATEGGVYKNKPKNYHQEKFLLAREAGVNLITIYDKDIHKNKKSVLEKLKKVLTGENVIMPTRKIEYTDNDWGTCEYMKSFGYTEVSQEEPKSFKYKKYTVYNSGRTIWNGMNK